MKIEMYLLVFCENIDSICYFCDLELQNVSHENAKHSDARHTIPE